MVKRAYTPESVEAPQEGVSVTLRIEGLRPTYDADGTFVLENVSMVAIDYSPVMDLLMRNNVPEDIAINAIDDLANTVWIGMMSRELAKRMTRA